MKVRSRSQHVLVTKTCEGYEGKPQLLHMFQYISVAPLEEDADFNAINSQE